MQRKERKTIEWERLETSSRKLDTKGIFHAKMGTIKDIKSMTLTEAEAYIKQRHILTEQKHILRRGGKNGRKNYTKKIFMTQIATMV